MSEGANEQSEWKAAEEIWLPRGSVAFNKKKVDTDAHYIRADLVRQEGMKMANVQLVDQTAEMGDLLARAMPMLKWTRDGHALYRELEDMGIEPVEAPDDIKRLLEEKDRRIVKLESERRHLNRRAVRLESLVASLSRCIIAYLEGDDSLTDAEKLTLQIVKLDTAMAYAVNWINSFLGDCESPLTNIDEIMRNSSNNETV